MRILALFLAVVGAWFVRADRLVPILAVSQDAVRPARGIQLSFVRSYATSTNSFCEKGLLGYGWSDNLTASFRREGPDVLVFPSSSVDGQTFVEVKNKWCPAYPGDATELSETTDAYVLKYENGVTRSFSKENSRTSFIQDSQGNSLVFTWQGNELRRVTHVDGQSLTFTYANGLMASVVDDCGRKTEFRYGDGYLVGVVSHDGCLTKYKYGDVGTNLTARILSRILYPDGRVRCFAYDNSGRVSAISEGAVDGKSAARKTTITRSDDGVTVVVAPDGGRSVLKFGKRGEVLQTTDALGNARRYAYSTNGLLESVTAPNGGKVSVEYDKRGRIAALIAASSAKTKFSYTKSFGNLERVMDANGQDLSYDYDSLGRAVSVTFPDGSSSRLSYNARGDMMESRNRRAQAIARICDAQGRVIRMTWPDGRMFQYSYDARGNLVLAQDSETGVVMMSYDKNDRMTRIAYPGNRGLEFVHDSFGRILSRKLFGDGSESAAAVEKFAYDAEGRLASLSDGDGKSYLVNEYDAKTGRLTRQIYGNGTVVSNAYDRLGRIMGIYHGRAVSEKPPHLAFFEYTYDADGRCMASRSQDGWETYAYDADGQLTAAFYPNGAKDTFSYDVVGNRKTSGETVYTVNSLNQYITISSASASASPREECLAYDLDGNMVSQKDDKGETRYFYDVLNRLVAVTNEAAGVRWSCKYDALGNRVSVTDNGVTTERIFIPGVLPSVAAEFVDGKLTKRHIVAGVVHAATLTTDHSTLTTSHYTLTTTYYHGDIIGSVRLVTDESGGEISRPSYTAFGSPREGRAPTRPSSVGYVGMLGVETDPTGLLFMRNRYYSPNLGRFITPDPIGLAGGDVNWYRYCGNVPICLIDPNGLVVATGIQAINNSTYLSPAKQGWSASFSPIQGGCGAVSGSVGIQFGRNAQGDWSGGVLLGGSGGIGGNIASISGDPMPDRVTVCGGSFASGGFGLEHLECISDIGERSESTAMTIGLGGGVSGSIYIPFSKMAEMAKGVMPPSPIPDMEGVAKIIGNVIEEVGMGQSREDITVGGKDNKEKEYCPKPNGRKTTNRQKNESAKNKMGANHKARDQESDDDELSPDQIPDPDNDNYVWCEDVCGEEGMRPVCPADTSHCIYWGCSRCGHVIRKKARKAKRQERIWKAQGIEGVWHGSQFDVRQAKSAE